MKGRQGEKKEVSDERKEREREMARNKKGGWTDGWAQ